MDLMNFFNAYPGVHLVQAFLHSLTAMIVADRAVRAWNIRSPVIRQKFHLIAVFGPVFFYPLYQWFNPGRGSIQFRLDALFDSGRWLDVELWGVLPALWLILVVPLATTAMFLIQELVPILRHRQGSEDPASRPVPAVESSPVVLAAGELVPRPPDIFVIQDDDPEIHSATSRQPAIYVTTGLLRRLQPAELKVAIAHEIAHIRRSRTPLLVVAYMMRVLLFFSPGTLVAFRKAADEEEKICDDWAARVTGRPDALATVLEKLRHSAVYEIGDRDPDQPLSEMERMSYDLLVRDRIRRLAEYEPAPAVAGDWFKFAVTVVAILVMNYYIV
jgi:Zn-dependent protease with chaperone function